MVKRGQSGLCGLVLIDKPAQMTSHDVVSRCRRIFSEKRIGHTGTLDPDATGCLLICVGPATRLVPYLASSTKSYEATIMFGTETNTDDASGEVTRTAPVPDEVSDPFFAAQFAASLAGEHEQVPPAFSAIKVAGKVSYKEARKGNAVELAPRTIEVFSASLLGIDVDPYPAWHISLEVSKGTYIRSIARDIGRAVDSAAHLGALRRTSLGHLDIREALTLNELAEKVESCGPQSVFIDPVKALGMDTIRVSGDIETMVFQGKAVPRNAVDAQSLPKDGCVALVSEDRLISVHMLDPKSETLRPKTTIAKGVSGARG